MYYEEDVKKMIAIMSDELKKDLGIGTAAGAYDWQKTSHVCRVCGGPMGKYGHGDVGFYCINECKKLDHIFMDARKRMSRYGE